MNDTPEREAAPFGNPEFEYEPAEGTTADGTGVAQELEDARKEIVRLADAQQQEHDRALRLAAELENTRRRLERDKADAVQYAAAGFAREMLSVADNLARALAAIGDDAPDTVNPIRQGIEATARELAAIFERHGVRKVPAVGLPLDPNVHQAMIEIADGSVEPGTIVQEIQSGYQMKERLLRPALVGVAKAAEGAASDAANAATPPAV